MDNVIVRGTTPSLIVDFSSIAEFRVSDIEEAALTFRRKAQLDTYSLSDLDVSETSLAYHWSQEQTLDMTAGERIEVDLHIRVNGERYKVRGVPPVLKVENALYEEVL